MLRKMAIFGRDLQNFSCIMPGVCVFRSKNRNMDGQIYDMTDRSAPPNGSEHLDKHLPMGVPLETMQTL